MLRYVIVMVDLHETLLGIRGNGWDRHIESPDFPAGVSCRDVQTSLLDCWNRAVLIMPAYLVPESRTANRLSDAGGSLSERTVVVVV